MLKPQDIVILLKLIALDFPFATYESLASSLKISTSEVHKGLDRAAQAHLYDERTRKPIRSKLTEFIIHGVPYAFAVSPGRLTRGMCTSYAAPPLKHLMVIPSGSPVPVWPTPTGTVTGYTLQPLYSSVPEAAQIDSKFYELMALVDALREGRARERNLAIEHLKKRLQS